MFPQIPWFNLYSSKTTIDVEGLHLLIVPSTSVKYDANKAREQVYVLEDYIYFTICAFPRLHLFIKCCQLVSALTYSVRNQ